MTARTVLVALALCAVACARPPVAAQPVIQPLPPPDPADLASQQAAAASAAPVNPPGWDDWLARFKGTLVARGLPATTVEATLGGLTYNARVVALDRAQADESRIAGPAPSFRDYLGRRLDAARINGGRLQAADLAPVLARIEASSGVSAPILLGIWGMETNYGGNTGGFDLFRALASLAFDGRRRELFERELEAAVRIVAEGRAPRERLVGSWAGATGQPQFLPSSYLAHGADGDGDGVRDIWYSRSDTLASIARYLAANGWQRGQGWGMAVYVPPTLDRARIRNPEPPAKCPRVLEKHSRWISVAEWRAMGVQTLGSARWPADDRLMASLVEPDGPGTGGYLTYGNYRALLEYNCSNFYALSVALLADAIAEAGSAGEPVAGGGVQPATAAAGGSAAAAGSEDR